MFWLGTGTSVKVYCRFSLFRLDPMFRQNVLAETWDQSSAYFGFLTVFEGLCHYAFIEV